MYSTHTKNLEQLIFSFQCALAAKKFNEEADNKFIVIRNKVFLRFFGGVDYDLIDQWQDRARFFAAGFDAKQVRGV